jgi:hypothetical protein
MDPLFLDDGFNRPHHVPAVPGLHPAVDAVFRPALSRERTAYAAALAPNDPDRVDKYECDLLARHVLEINGRPAAEWKGRLAKLHPAVKANLVNVVLGYSAAKTPEEEVAVFPSASG